MEYQIDYYALDQNIYITLVSPLFVGKQKFTI